MNRILTLCTFIFLTANLSGQVEFCAIFGEYDDEPLSEVIDKIESWCKVKIIYQDADIQDIVITNEFDGTPFKRAFEEILSESLLGYMIIDDKTIELRKKSSIVKYISITGDFKNVALSEVFNEWEADYKIEIESIFLIFQMIGILIQSI